MSNTLIASGPDFRANWTDKMPTGNIDIAPTILWLLGLEPLQPMDGRVLKEALRGAGNDRPFGEMKMESHRDLGESTWRQMLRLTTGEVSYFVEGMVGACQSSRRGCRLTSLTRVQLVADFAPVFLK